MYGWVARTIVVRPETVTLRFSVIFNLKYLKVSNFFPVFSEGCFTYQEGNVRRSAVGQKLSIDGADCDIHISRSLDGLGVIRIPNWQLPII